MRAIVEVIPARIDGDQIRYLVTRRDSPRGADPDATARAEVARLFPTLWLRRVIVHSTSWRYARETIVLTYIAYSDDLPVAQLPLVLPHRLEEARGDAAVVAAHAVRHFAFLVRDSRDGYATYLRRESAAYFAHIEPDIAGRIYLAGAA